MKGWTFATKITTIWLSGTKLHKLFATLRVVEGTAVPFHSVFALVFLIVEVTLSFLSEVSWMTIHKEREVSVCSNVPREKVLTISAS